LGAETIPDDRPISDAEGSLVLWILRNASVAGDLSHLESSLADLRVVGIVAAGVPAWIFRSRGRPPEPSQ